MRTLLTFTLVSTLAIGACGDDDDTTPGTDGGPVGTDGGPVDTDGGPIDTDGGPVDTDGGPMADAGPDEDGGPTPSCPDLMPTGDEELVISQIDLATRRVELFNPGSEDFIIGDHRWCYRPSYPQVTSTGPTMVPAGGYAIYTLPNEADWVAGTELALYLNTSYAVPTSVVDFVCWGDRERSPTNSRRSTAEAGGRWSGDCLPVPTMGAIRRRPSTAGTSAADYDTTSAFAPTECD